MRLSIRLRGNFNTQRSTYEFKRDMERMAWIAMKAQMVEFFQTRPTRDSSVSVDAISWPRFAPKEKVLDEGYIPAIIGKYGIDRKVLIKKADLNEIAFDDGPDAHVSHLFKGRLFNIAVDNQYLEPCIVSEYKAHPVNQDISFVKFSRQLEGIWTELEIPITLTGLFGCPAVMAGGTVELRKPTITVLCPGYNIPPPFLVDCSHLSLSSSPNIYLSDLESQLPKGVSFSRKYKDFTKIIIVESFDYKTVEETKLPLDYQDPNFTRKSGKKVHLTHSGFWPKQ
jgi:hypothetical protein